MKKLIIAAAFLLLANVAVADFDFTNAKIVHIFSGYDSFDGMFIKLDQTIGEPGCSSDTLFLSASHIKFSETYSLILSAASGNKQLNGGSSGCLNSSFPQLRYAYVEY